MTSVKMIYLDGICKKDYPPLKTNMTFQNPHFFIHGGFSIVMLVLGEKNPSKLPFLSEWVFGWGSDPGYEHRF